MEIYKEFTFEAAHRLPNAPPEHKCARLHGHSFRVRLHVAGSINDESGWIQDYGDLSRAFAPVLEMLDHTYLNDVAGLENPTSENLCRWICMRVAPLLPGLSKVVVNETCATGCIYGRNERGEWE
jgi:6-pyruvoyltetrahydropterin/6-carboxytetrahydropterin synthase